MKNLIINNINDLTNKLKMNKLNHHSMSNSNKFDQNSLNENETTATTTTTTSSCSENEEEYAPNYEEEHNNDESEEKEAVATAASNNQTNLVVSTIEENEEEEENADDDEYVCENFVQTYSVLETHTIEAPRQCDENAIDEEDEVVEEYFIQEESPFSTTTTTINIDDNNNNLTSSSTSSSLFVKKTPIAVQVLPESAPPQLNHSSSSRSVRINNLANSLLTPCVNGNFKPSLRIANNNNTNNYVNSNDSINNNSNHNNNNAIGNGNYHSFDTAKFNGVQGMLFYKFYYFLTTINK